MWRLKGWQGYIEVLANKNGLDVRTQSIIMPLDDYSAEVYEAGADAMLKAVVAFIGGVFSEKKWKVLSEGVRGEDSKEEVG